MGTIRIFREVRFPAFSINVSCFSWGHLKGIFWRESEDWCRKLLMRSKLSQFGSFAAHSSRNVKILPTWDFFWGGTVVTVVTPCYRSSCTEFTATVSRCPDSQKICQISSHLEEKHMAFPRGKLSISDNFPGLNFGK